MSQVTPQAPVPPGAAFPPSAPPGAPPPEPGPPGTAPPFAGLLEEQSTARTAPAEGDKKKGPQATPAAPAEGTATTAPTSEAPTAEGTAGEATTPEGASGESTPGEPTVTAPTGEAAVAMVASTALPVPTGAAPVSSATTTEPAPTTAHAVASAPAQSASEPTVAVPVPTVPQAEAPPVEGEEKQGTVTPSSATPEDKTEAPTARAPVTTGSIALPESVKPIMADSEPSISAAPSAPAPTGEKTDASPTETGAQRSGDEQTSRGQERAPEAPLPRTTAVGAPSFATAQPAASASPLANADVTFSSPAAPAPAPTAALEATLRMAGQAGFTRARVTLRPAELGGVEVFLREGSAGLSATVVADTPHAAQLLQSSATELQRRLAAQGLELSSLQISVGGESAGAAHGGSDRQASTAGARGATAEAGASEEQTQTIDLGGGVLVDVLA